MFEFDVIKVPPLAIGHPGTAEKGWNVCTGGADHPGGKSGIYH